MEALSDDSLQFFEPFHGRALRSLKVVVFKVIAVLSQCITGIPIQYLSLQAGFI